MNQYEDAGGRLLEWLIGIMAACVGLVFVGLICIVLLEASLSIASVLGGALLAVLGYWFFAIAWRLFSGRRNQHGGLIGNTTIKVFSSLLGLSGILMAYSGFTEGEYNLAFSGLLGLPAWWAGWKLARKRSGSVEI